MNKDKTCILVGSSAFKEIIKVDKDDYLVAVDGGYDILSSFSLVPDLVIGDFDSAILKPAGKNVIEYPKEKDETDMMIAAKFCLQKGFNKFKIYGGLGGRLSHTLSNIILLTYLLDNNSEGILYSDKETIQLLKNGCLSFSAQEEGYISVFSLSKEAKGVTLSNLKYPLNNYDLKENDSIGQSNEFTGKEAKIEVKKGTLLIIKERK